MIIFLRKNAGKESQQKILLLLETHSVGMTVTEFQSQTTIIVTDPSSGGNIRNSSLFEAVSACDGVDKIVPVTEAYPLASKKTVSEGTLIQVDGFSVGRRNFGVIAGPCTVESEKQTIQTAIAVKSAGATALRGGAFKPRTSPYAFQGLKEHGLKILAKAKAETGLAIVTEAMSPEEINIVAEYADIVQIGTRNAQNYRLLEAAGRIRKPILLKRGYMCSLDEFLMSAEYILAGGNDRVILCERGIRTHETYIRFTLPIAAIPELHTKTHLPVIVDPSHSAGKASLVSPLALAATAAGADGLLIEVHPDPNVALCDGKQSLSFDEFQQLMKDCNSIYKIVN